MVQDGCAIHGINLVLDAGLVERCIVVRAGNPKVVVVVMQTCWCGWCSTICLAFVGCGDDSFHDAPRLNMPNALRYTLLQWQVRHTSVG